MMTANENLLRAARNFEELIGRKEVPFVIAIYNSETERIEFVTNMAQEDYENFVTDIAEQVHNPDVREAHPRRELNS